MKLVSRSESHQQGHYVAPPRTLVFAGLFLMVFFGVGAWSFIQSLEPLTWKSVPCTVTQFTLTDNAESDTPFGAEVKFVFEFDGKIHEGNKLGIPGWKDSRDQIRHLLKLEKHRSAASLGGGRASINEDYQQQMTCYLPDGNPDNAVLFRPSFKGAGLAFVGFAVTVGWILYQAHIYRDSSTEKLSRKVMPAFAFFFGSPGLLLLIYLSLPVWVESIQVRSWKETPARIVWAEIRSERGSKSTNCSADICYEYQAEGRTFRQNRIYPGDLDAGGYSSAAKLVQEYPLGTEVTCHVDPKSPERSVLIPDAGWALLWTLFPLPFLGIGILMLWASFSKTKQRRTRS